MASLMIGLPGETDEHLRETLAWVESLGNERLAIFPVLFAPVDGTPPLDPRTLRPLHWALIRACYRLELPLGSLVLPRQSGRRRHAAGPPHGAATDGLRPDSSVEDCCLPGIRGGRGDEHGALARNSASQLADAFNAVRDRLLQSRNPDGFWEGRLSSSALSTATALSALSLADDPADAARIGSGVAWLAGNQNADGGWGDTTDSPSNLATTLLAIAALTLAGVETASPFSRHAGKGARRILSQRHPTDTIVAAIQREYGEDRTFAVPILMNCGLAGLVAWHDIPGLPFELAALPHGWYKALRLHVVSYALPALIAIGLLIDRHNPPASIVRRLIRKMAHAARAGEACGTSSPITADSSKRRR